MSVLSKHDKKTVQFRIFGTLTGRKWVNSALEAMEVSRFWSETHVNCVARGEKWGADPDLDEKVAGVDQAAVAI